MTQDRSKERIAEIASRQGGRISYAQLRRLGLAGSTIAGWKRSGYLRASLPGVFAVGHSAPSWEASLWGAVLYAGPGAALSHGTAARRRGLIDFAPTAIDVRTPHQKRSLAGVRVHVCRQGFQRELYRGIPVTTIPATMVDLAAGSGPRVLQRALGQLDFRRLLDADALLRACGHGRRGSSALRAAIESYDPRYKYANGPLEEDFLELCRRRGLPLPVLNSYVHGIRSDAYWPRQGLVVELDSELAHASPAQRRRDRRNDLELRRHGLTLHRYDWELVHERADEVFGDILSMLERLVIERRARAVRAQSA